MSRLSSRSSRPSNLQHSPLHAVRIIVTTPHTDHYPGPTQAKQESLPRPLPRAYPGQTRITTQTTTPGLPRPNKNHYTDRYPGPTQAKQESLPRPLPWAYPGQTRITTQTTTPAKQESLLRPLPKAYRNTYNNPSPHPTVDFLVFLVRLAYLHMHYQSTLFQLFVEGILKRNRAESCLEARHREHGLANEIRVPENILVLGTKSDEGKVRVHDVKLAAFVPYWDEPVLL